MASVTSLDLVECVYHQFRSSSTATAECRTIPLLSRSLPSCISYVSLHCAKIGSKKGNHILEQPSAGFPAVVPGGVASVNDSLHAL